MRARKEAIMVNMRGTRKFVRYNEGTRLYSMGVYKFRQLTHEAGVVCKMDKITLVDTEKFEKCLGSFAET